MDTKVFLSAALLAVAAGCSSASLENASVGEVTEAASASGQYSYAFDKTGLTTSVGNGTTSFTVSSSGDTLRAGTDVYKIDPLGRVVAVKDLALTYGPDGQVAKAVRGVKTAAYVYDENGERLLKRSDGVPTEAYVDGRYVSATELVEPVRVAGKMVGLLRNGRFTLVATDYRGTVEADSNGTAHLASPFGARPLHADVSSITDYAEKGYDAELGSLRMGVRDYDGNIGRFLEPDPLFLEHPEKCVKSPVECNLYGYAVNRPLEYVDPAGKDVVFLLDRSGAGGQGHMGMLLQNKDGAWFYMSQGTADQSVSQASYLAGSTAHGGVEFGRIVVQDATGASRSATRDEAIAMAASGELGTRYTDTLQMKTTNSQDATIAKNAVDLVRQHATGEKTYSLYFNNCVDAVQDAVQTDTKIDLPIDFDPRPTKYFEKLQENIPHVP
jgi:RHS repeat-associated protein